MEVKLLEANMHQSFRGAEKEPRNGGKQGAAGPPHSAAPLPPQPKQEGSNLCGQDIGSVPPGASERHGASQRMGAVLWNTFVLPKCTKARTGAVKRNEAEPD